MKILVGARTSPLAKAQVKEIQSFYPEIELEHIPVITTGDRDRHTSLKTLGKTDFFTKEIDEQQLKGQFRVSVHSAKDLPEALVEGLVLVALTKGVDASDALVLREGETLESLSQGATIATSSLKREEAVKQLKRDLTFTDIRGNIEERLEKLLSHQVDGVVIAEAALIRLNLTHLNRITLPGKTTPLQGKLALIARKGDEEMLTLFSKIDTRKTLHVGLTSSEQNVVHCPLIKTVPKKYQLPQKRPTHLIFTSKTAVQLYAPHIEDQVLISVGKGTTASLENLRLTVTYTAKEESAEGVVNLLREIPSENHHFFWPHSSRARSVISDFLKSCSYSFEEEAIYETQSIIPEKIPNLQTIKEVYFTSPSTVDAFLSIYKTFPEGIKLSAIGPVTHSYLSEKRQQFHR